MDLRYLAVICFGVVALFLCVFAGIFAKREKIKTFIFYKSLANFSYIVLALVCCNVVYRTDAYSLFIICALVGFLLSTILKALPTKTDMFRIFYTLVDSISIIFLFVALLFTSTFSLIGLIVGIALFIVLMIIYLVLKKSQLTKEKLVNLLFLLCVSFFFGFAINAILAFSTRALLILIGGTLICGFVILQIFTSTENKKATIAKAFILDIALILLALSIFLI